MFTAMSRAYAQSTTSSSFTRHLTSWILPPVVLASIRLLFALYIFSTIFVGIGILLSTGSAEVAQDSFAYFTVLTWWGLGFYFLVSAIHGFIYTFRGRAGLAGGSNEITGVSRWRGALRAAHGWYYASITTFPFVVSVVFWAVLAGKANLSDVRTYDTYTQWDTISQHGLNLVFAIFEIVMTRTEATAWWQLIPCFITALLYLALTYVNVAVRHFYVYPFLDPTKSSPVIIAAYIVGILGSYIVLFIVVRYLICLRQWVTESKLSRTGKLSALDGGDFGANDGFEIITVMHQLPAKAGV